MRASTCPGVSLKSKVLEECQAQRSINGGHNPLLQRPELTLPPEQGLGELQFSLGDRVRCVTLVIFKMLLISQPLFRDVKMVSGQQWLPLHSSVASGRRLCGSTNINNTQQSSGWGEVSKTRQSIRQKAVRMRHLFPTSGRQNIDYTKVKGASLSGLCLALFRTQPLSP